ncbi:AraC family transcriptional regulator [uncultured Massilia sp.]|uniref:helix-turn-helix transcriptional regulator n=1 Tax=uncultured Massilia sp. TaxID=169973 RepID=UPI0025E61E4C|nr:AraC family transcriptional regulator [uncultured Massilia sp.]
MHSLPLALHVRSYGQVRESDRHDFAQLVLPLAGSVTLEIEGREARLDPLQAAFVAPRAWHAQCAHAHNRHLIVDLDLAAVDPDVAARLHQRAFLRLGPEARKLVECMGMLAGRQAATPRLLAGWTPLLLDTLVLDAVRAPSRLAALLASVEADPGGPWDTASMARRAGLSPSRLHALFRSELDTTPHDWLLRLRLERVCDRLVAGNEPVAVLAQWAGFSDQSALTRAMRRTLDVTPADYRRRHGRAARA